MSDAHRRAWLIRAAIWLATLFFVAMLFVPLVREAVRRAAEQTPGEHF